MATNVRTDGAYSLTRRRGKSTTITRLTAQTADPKTGVKTPTETTSTVRWVFKQPTQYIRLFRAEQTQTRVGDTTFIMWLPDVEDSFTALSQEDSITYQGERFDVVSSSIEDNAFIVTARKFE